MDEEHDPRPPQPLTDPDDGSALSAEMARAALLRAIAELAEPNADGNRVQIIRTLAQSLAQLTESDHDRRFEKIQQRLELAEARLDELEKNVPPVASGLVADALRAKFSGPAERRPRNVAAASLGRLDRKKGRPRRCDNEASPQ